MRCHHDLRGIKRLLSCCDCTNHSLFLQPSQLSATHRKNVTTASSQLLNRNPFVPYYLSRKIARLLGDLHQDVSLQISAEVLPSKERAEIQEDLALGQHYHVDAIKLEKERTALASTGGNETPENGSSTVNAAYRAEFTNGKPVSPLMNSSYTVLAKGIGRRIGLLSFQIPISFGNQRIACFCSSSARKRTPSDRWIKNGEAFQARTNLTDPRVVRNKPAHNRDKLQSDTETTTPFESEGQATGSKQVSAADQAHRYRRKNANVDIGLEERASADMRHEIRGRNDNELSGHRKRSTTFEKAKNREHKEVEAHEKEPWQTQKAALEKKFGDDGWNPRKRLSPDALEGIRALHKADPEKFSTPILANQFQVSSEAIRRILKSKWQPNEQEAEDRQRRWDNRGERIWSGLVERGIRPPKKWRQMGVGKAAPGMAPKWKLRKGKKVDRSGRKNEDSILDNDDIPLSSIANRIL
ncbi:MAG: Required for respiratory growth protein 9 mitochondrial [Bathelium mastoideum]|nr:MAG: Required for respiratory growth protein 9 mitochondrial [Bathelium mastoideum]KAI9690979.1 MAG: Required for respiratory growth protein 9 mitochondrial [Bathelium mastoideum]